MKNQLQAKLALKNCFTKIKKCWRKVLLSREPDFGLHYYYLASYTLGVSKSFAGHRIEIFKSFSLSLNFGHLKELLIKHCGAIG